MSSLALLVAQLAAVVVLPAYDALLEAELFGVSLHMEAPTTDCAVAHDEFFCKVLRSQAHGRPESAGPSVLAASSLCAHAQPQPRLIADVIRSAGAVGPRAPPLV